MIPHCTTAVHRQKLETTPSRLAVIDVLGSDRVLDQELPICCTMAGF
jgi:hypothetical protein